MFSSSFLQGFAALCIYSLWSCNKLFDKILHTFFLPESLCLPSSPDQSSCFSMPLRNFYPTFAIIFLVLNKETFKYLAMQAFENILWVCIVGLISQTWQVVRPGSVFFLCFFFLLLTFHDLNDYNIKSNDDCFRQSLVQRH